MNVQVLGISVDHVPCLQAWADSLEGISFPLLSDFWPHGAVAEKYDVFREDGTSERAIFLIDEEGVIRYKKVHPIDERPDNEVLFKKLRRIVPEQVRSGQVQGETEVSASDQEDIPLEEVVMYCNNWCPDCRRARSWLDQHQIPYTEINVSQDRAAAKQVKEWADGNLVTPTFNIQGTIVIDWDEEKLTEILL